MKDFIETRILGAIRKLLTERVNQIISDSQYAIPLIEFGDYSGSSTLVPMIALTVCEQTEKERVIRLDAYSLTITFSIPESTESELHCYAYSGAVSKAFYDDPTMGGVVDRVVVTGKKYLSPKKPHCGELWGLVVTLRVTVEGLNNAG